jgi:hypothetical protein
MVFDKVIFNEVTFSLRDSYSLCTAKLEYCNFGNNASITATREKLRFFIKYLKIVSLHSEFSNKTYLSLLRNSITMETVYCDHR